MIKRRRGFIIGLLVIVLLTISFVIITNNKEKEKGGLTVFEVNSSKIIITDNDKSMTIVDGELCSLHITKKARVTFGW